MSLILRECLNEAKATLERVEGALIEKSGIVPSDVNEAFELIVKYRPDIDHWITMVDARAAAWKILDELKSKTDTDEGQVPFGPTRGNFVHMRLIGVQAYVTAKWALADCITDMAGHVFRAPNIVPGKIRHTQLVSHFIQKNNKKMTTDALLDNFLRYTFGWPAVISYAIRNHFVHNGGQIKGVNFFDADTYATAFKISDEGWSYIVEIAKEKYADDSSDDARKKWQAMCSKDPPDDLLDVLRVCEQETDKALVVLLGTACNILRSHVRFMLGQA